MKRDSIAVGAAAFLAGTVGTAGAASTLIDSGDIKNNSIKLKDLSKSARKALRGKRGPAGPVGLAGQNGAPGEPGAPGAPGAGGALYRLLSPEGSYYFSPYPHLATGASSDEDAVTERLPALTARRLSVHTDFASKAATTITLRLDGQDTGLACTIPASEQACTAGSAVEIPAGAFGSLAVSSIDKHSLSVAIGFEPRG